MSLKSKDIFLGEASCLKNPSWT